MADIKMDMGIVRSATSSFGGCLSSASAAVSASRRAMSAANEVYSVNRYLYSQLASTSSELEKIHSCCTRLSHEVQNMCQEYENAERENIKAAEDLRNQVGLSAGASNSSATHSTKASTSKSSDSSNSKKGFWDYFKESYKWTDFAKAFGSFGGLLGASYSLANSKTVWDVAKNGTKVVSTILGIMKDAKNYSKIGRAVGNKKAVSWFFKKELGFRATGYASTAKTGIVDRFFRNLTNKSSPYNIKDAFSSFTGGKGAAKCVAAWAGVAITAVTSAISNVDEQKQSGGKMSTGRVVAETVTETALTTAVGIGATCVVGAAIAAVTGAVAAPALVAVVAGVGVAAIDSGFKAATGGERGLVECASDTILNAGKMAIEAIKTGGKSTGSTGGSQSFWTRLTANY